jgi:hypothetical protein
MTAELRALPETDAPSDLASIVMARIAQLPESGSAAATVTRGAVAATRRPDWAPALIAIGGVVAGLALIVTMPTGADVLGQLVTPRFSAPARWPRCLPPGPRCWRLPRD